MTEKDEISTLINKIVAKRREMEISPQNMADRSKMNKDYIIAIEKGEFDKLPVGYERMFVRTYLKLLTFEQDEIENYLSIFFDQNAPTQKSHPADISKPKEHIEEEFKNTVDLVNLKKILIWLPALIVIVLLFYIVYENLDTVENPEKIPEMSMEKSIASLDTIDQDAASIINEDDSLTLKIDIIKPVFFLVNSDSMYKKQVRGKAGVRYTFRAKDQFNVYASNGSYLNFTLNDSNLGVLTRDKIRISYLIIEKNGIIAKGLVPIETKIDTTVSDSISD